MLLLLLLGLGLVGRRYDDVRVRRLHRLLVLLGMMRRLVQHPWHRRWRQLLILHSATHPITSRAHLISSLVAPLARRVGPRAADASPRGSSFHSHRRERRARIRGKRCRRRRGCEEHRRAIHLRRGQTRSFGRFPRNSVNNSSPLITGRIDDDHRGPPPVFESGPGFKSERRVESRRVCCDYSRQPPQSVSVSPSLSLLESTRTSVERTAGVSRSGFGIFRGRSATRRSQLEGGGPRARAAPLSLGYHHVTVVESRSPRVIRRDAGRTSLVALTVGGRQN